MIDPTAQFEIEKRLDALSDQIDEFKRSILAQEKMYLVSLYRIGVSQGRREKEDELRACGGQVEVVK